MNSLYAFLLFSLEKLKAIAFFVKKAQFWTLYMHAGETLSRLVKKLNPTDLSGCQVNNVNFDSCLNGK
jgi:hypothetical protein